MVIPLTLYDTLLYFIAVGIVEIAFHTFRIVQSNVVSKWLGLQLNRFFEPNAIDLNEMNGFHSPMLLYHWCAVDIKRLEEAIKFIWLLVFAIAFSDGRYSQGEEPSIADANLIVHVTLLWFGIMHQHLQSQNTYLHVQGVQSEWKRVAPCVRQWIATRIKN